MASTKRGATIGLLATLLCAQIGLRAQDRYVKDRNGQTPKPQVVVDNACGWPNPSLLPDGRVLTAYYAKQIVGHPRYHVGIVIWDPEETFAKRAQPK